MQQEQVFMNIIKIDPTSVQCSVQYFMEYSCIVCIIISDWWFMGLITIMLYMELCK